MLVLMNGSKTDSPRHSCLLREEDLDSTDIIQQIEIWCNDKKQ